MISLNFKRNKNKIIPKFRIYSFHTTIIKRNLEAKKFLRK